MTPTKRMLQQLVTDQVVPGLSAAIMDEQQVWTEVIGEAQWVPQTAPLRPGMTYDLASLTKVLGTTTVFLQALAASQVKLDQSIHDWLPEFKPNTTFREALTHTSGLESYIPHRDELSASALRQALIDTLKPTGPKTVLYRDFNLLLVGWALENVFKAPIQTLIQQRVLNPLQLTGASFHPDPRNTVPTTYANGHLLQGIVHDPKARILGEHAGSAGLFATLQDLITYTQYAFGQRTTTAFPAAAFSTLTQDFAGGRTLGWDLRYDASGGIWLYHTGYTGGFWLMQPQTQQALIVLSNRVHPQVNADFLARRDEIVAQYLQDVVK
ncbi:serine hydrolase domain-containing protein [Lacticaseibacillus porcinae]|uniref:serine hydrolase domain-containing protein n=1 Tax=Lacticaseibacillus porcinae TaxID=1123687 RepID=UPI000F7B3755|nr:serine hydrolase domain-containing protein [Lacticaseibacillus porcinae]